MEKEVNLKNLIDDLNYTQKINDDRYRVLVLQLYLEHFINAIIEIKSKEFPLKLIKSFLNFPKKIELLRYWEIIEEDMAIILQTLSEVRNDLIHSLIIDKEKIKRKLEKTNFEFVKDETGQNKMKLFGFLPPKEQLISATTVIIYHLYQHLEKLRGNEISQVMSVEVKEEEGIWKNIIHVLQKKSS